MERDEGLELRFQLGAAGRSVHGRLRRRGERWIAEVERGGRTSVAVATAPREALMAALEPLGTRSAQEVLADPALFAVSADLLGMVGRPA